MHTLGSAMAVLGAVLLITKRRAARRLLWPVGVAGAMTLTIYCAHVLVLGSGLLNDNPLTLYVVSVAAALGFAVLWRTHRTTWRWAITFERYVLAKGYTATPGRRPGERLRSAGSLRSCLNLREDRAGIHAAPVQPLTRFVLLSRTSRPTVS
jgi:hypothetical protein